MKTTKILKLSSTIALALAISNTALALDARCSTSSSQVPYCIGTDNELSGTPQKALLIGPVDYGLIVKNFDYLVPEHAGGSTAEECCGGWTAGLISWGHMSAPDDWSSYYKKGARGLYVDKVKILGESSWQRIAGVMHANALSTNTSHRDTLFVDNVTIDIANTNTSPFTSPDTWWKYPVYGVSSFTEGNNKNSIVTVDGDSQITVRKTCKIGEACFAAEGDSSGISAAAIRGYATANIGTNVVVTAKGDMVHGTFVKTRSAGTAYTSPDGTIDNKGTISTNGDSSNALYIFNDRVTGEQATVKNTGLLQTFGKVSHGIAGSGYKNYTITNEGSIYAFGEDASGIIINKQKANNNINSISLNLTGQSVVLGGSGTNASGIKFINSAGTKSINNSGYISSINYKSIDATSNNTGSFTLNNSGTINGYQVVLDNVVAVTNQTSGAFNLENFDQAGQSIAVVSRFSNKNTAVFKNSGAVQFDESMNTCSTNTGTYTGIKEFYANPTSKIDLTTNNPLNTFLGVGKNNEIGDRFTITNDTNDAIYYSNGGTISLNVDLTKANQANVENRLTDRVILDKVVTLNNQPTLINIVPTKDSLTKAQATATEGILLIEVKNSSDNNAFALAKPVKVAGKEYVLKQVNKSWYLVSNTLN